MPVSLDGRATKALSLTQRSAQAMTRLATIVARSDAKLLAVAVAEAAAEQAERDSTLVRAIQIMYDALAATTKQPKPKPGGVRAPKELIPIVSGGEIAFNRDDKPDAYELQRVYGNHQLRDALEGYTLSTLKEMSEVVMGRNPGTPPPNKRSKVAVIDYIVACLTGQK